VRFLADLVDHLVVVVATGRLAEGEKRIHKSIKSLTQTDPLLPLLISDSMDRHVEDTQVEESDTEAEEASMRLRTKDLGIDERLRKDQQDVSMYTFFYSCNNQQEANIVQGASIVQEANMTRTER
jgi:hypothetical protein